MLLGVNIDHIATLRNARGGLEPNLIQAALICEKAGADGITVHLREDRRHTKDNDVVELKNILKTRLNLEMAVTDEMQKIALEVLPTNCCLVPEKRQEVTTEGGLDVAGQFERVQSFVKPLVDAGIIVSLFIDADEKQVEAAYKTGAQFIELHTGKYSEAFAGSGEFSVVCLVDGCGRFHGSDGTRPRRGGAGSTLLPLFGLVDHPVYDFRSLQTISGGYRKYPHGDGRRPVGQCH